MKKILKITAALSVIAIATFGLAACGDTNDSDEAIVQEEGQVTAQEEPTEAYDIMEGVTTESVEGDQIITGNGWRLVMPDTEDWEIEQIEDDCFRVYMVAADKDGFGGDLVTIRAFASGDTEYKDFPSYAMAGYLEKYGKTFVAIFPTDVRFNPDDEGQMVLYNSLLEHVQRISKDNADSPFTVVAE